MNMHPPRQSEGDELVTEMRKAEAEEGDRRRKVGWSIYQKYSDGQMIR
jgi:hypothetical protein